MGALSLRLPESIHRHIREIAKAEGVSINQLISSAITEKISAIMTEEYLKERAGRANISDMEAILGKVADRGPLAGDEL
jgi:predicted DNA-binding ribbon-helix-helix protein